MSDSRTADTQAVQTVGIRKDDRPRPGACTRAFCCLALWLLTLRCVVVGPWLIFGLGFAAGLVCALVVGVLLIVFVSVQERPGARG